MIPHPPNCKEYWFISPDGKDPVLDSLGIGNTLTSYTIQVLLLAEFLATW